MGLTKAETKVEGEENDKAEWMKVHVIFFLLDFSDCAPWNFYALCMDEVPKLQMLVCSFQ